MDTRIEFFAESAAVLAASDDLDATVGRLLEIATRMLGALYAAVALQDPDRAELQVAVLVGGDQATRDGFAAEVASPGSLIAETAADRTPRMANGIVHIPLVVTRTGIDQTVGVLTIGRADDSDPGEAERALLGGLADLIAVAIDRARLSSLVMERTEWFERVAHTDPLTGLANDRTFRRVLDLEVARSARQGGEVSLAIFDVDSFAAINESAGHGVGDDILRTVAAVLAESVRLVDTVARLGGDEFVLIAPGAAGSAVARRVLDGVAKLSEHGSHPVSVSAGIARFPVDATTGEDLLVAARSALEAARRTGPGQLSAVPIPSPGE